MPDERDPQARGHLVGLPERHAGHFFQDLVDVTPTAFRCDLGVSCPAALYSPARKSFAIIGATVQHHAESALASRVAEHETAIEISEELLTKAVVATLLQQATFAFFLLLLGQLLLAIVRRPIKFLTELAARSVLTLLLRPFNLLR